MGCSSRLAAVSEVDLLHVAPGLGSGASHWRSGLGSTCNSALAEQHIWQCGKARR